MNAALSAGDRGHDVTLIEKTDKLGGQALLSDGLWFKKEMKLIMNAGTPGQEASSYQTAHGN